MASVKDVLAYLLQNHRNPRHFSAGRITKMIYLADWKHSISRGEQITPIEWYYNHYGPYVDKVVDAAKSYPELFERTLTENAYGEPKRKIECVDFSYSPDLTSPEKSSIDHVMRTTKDLDWSEFIKLVYSTYPIIRQDKHTTLDLPRLAEEYKHSEIYRSNGQFAAASPEPEAA